MAEIVEVFDDIKDKIGDKAFFILIGCAALFGLYNLSKGSGDSSEGSDLASTRVVTAVASYPDAVTNADVIISSLQNSIDYSEGQVIDAIQGSEEEMKEFLEQNFEATNNYINEGLESQKQLMEENMDTIMGGLDEIKEEVKDVGGTVSSGYNYVTSSVNTNTSAVNRNTSAVGSAVKTVTDVAAAIAKAVTSSKKSSGSSSSKKSNTEYYTYKTKSGYNTSTSIVDALKVATGNYDSKDTSATLKAVAKANGISNYTGTYSQNVSLLSKLKSGTLKKA